MEAEFAVRLGHESQLLRRELIELRLYVQI